jgi:outer membrane lipoprotein carrier protein
VFPFAGLAALLLSTASGLAGANVHQIAAAFEARYRNARTLKAAFFEVYRDGNGGEQAESGTVYFSRPGRMRWEYESPEQKLFLVDATNVWFYVPADHTASRAKLSQSSDWRTPLALLAGKIDLAHLCREVQAVEAPGRTSGASAGASSGTVEPHPAPGDALLRCIPKGSSPSDTLRDVLFELNPKSFLVRALIRESGNVSTEFRFGNWQEDIEIPEIKFHFEPPPGIAIVDEQALVGTVH